MKPIVRMLRNVIAPLLATFLLVNGVLHMMQPSPLLDDLTQLTFALRVEDPMLWSVWLVRVAIALEVTIALAYLYRPTRATGERAFVALIGSYTVYLALSWIIVGGAATCACQSFLGRMPVWAGIIRNATLIALALISSNRSSEALRHGWAAEELSSPRSL